MALPDVQPDGFRALPAAPFPALPFLDAAAYHWATCALDASDAALPDAAADVPSALPVAVFEIWVALAPDVPAPAAACLLLADAAAALDTPDAVPSAASPCGAAARSVVPA
jgi:hypothetical protein